jgi:CheY-like chemotaxis protein
MSHNRSRVLVVDDYADAREMYSEYLQLSGFESSRPPPNGGGAAAVEERRISS